MVSEQPLGKQQRIRKRRMNTGAQTTPQHCMLLDSSSMDVYHASEGREGFVEGQKQAESFILL